MPGLVSPYREGIRQDLLGKRHELSHGRAMLMACYAPQIIEGEYLFFKLKPGITSQSLLCSTLDQPTAV